jgi:hypothetical protein
MVRSSWQTSGTPAVRKLQAVFAEREKIPFEPCPLALGAQLVAFVLLSVLVTVQRFERTVAPSSTTADTRSTNGWPARVKARQPDPLAWDRRDAHLGASDTFTRAHDRRCR